MKVVRISNLDFMRVKGYDIFLNNVTEEAVPVSEMEAMLTEIKNIALKQYSHSKEDDIISYIDDKLSKLKGE